MSYKTKVPIPKMYIYEEYIDTMKSDNVIIDVNYIVNEEDKYAIPINIDVTFTLATRMINWDYKLRKYIEDYCYNDFLNSK